MNFGLLDNEQLRLFVAYLHRQHPELMRNCFNQWLEAHPRSMQRKRF